MIIKSAQLIFYSMEAPNTQLIDLSKFHATRVLNRNESTKGITLLGHFGDDIEKPAILLIEKNGFPLDEKAYSNLGETLENFQIYIDNDIFKNYTVGSKGAFDNLDIHMIYPAPQKFIDKYTKKEKVIISENAQFYKEVTLPLYINKTDLQLKWLKNILNKEAESERIIYDDPDPLNGFILLPDISFADPKNLDSLHVLAIVYRSDIKSLRDLNSDHLDFLKKILQDGKQKIESFYNLKPNKLRVYVHYLPTYFHFHVHFVHIENDNASSQVEKAHLLSTIIQNIEIDNLYYTKCTLEYRVDIEHVLYKYYIDKDKACM